MSYAGCKLTVGLKNNNLIEELANCRLTHKQHQGTQGYTIIRSIEIEVLLLASFCVD